MEKVIQILSLDSVLQCLHQVDLLPWHDLIGPGLANRTILLNLLCQHTQLVQLPVLRALGIQDLHLPFQVLLLYSCQQTRRSGNIQALQICTLPWPNKRRFEIGPLQSVCTFFQLDRIDMTTGVRVGGPWRRTTCQSHRIKCRRTRRQSRSERPERGSARIWNLKAISSTGWWKVQAGDR